MLKRLFRSFSRHKSGIALMSGAAAVLSGVERAMSARSIVAARCPGSKLTEEDRLRIYRSKSDLGYAYWVLQGRGCFQSFSLFDSWEQAVQEANRRLTVAHRVAAAPRPPAKRLVLASR